jgi:SET domain-containing protein
MPRVSTSQLSSAAQQRISLASQYKLQVFQSGVHRLGVCAGESIPAKRRVIEYAGERISRSETRRRFLHGSPGRGKKLNYLAQLDSYWTIDGGANGNGAELINHGCDPNLRLRKVRGRLCLFSIRKIRAGEELCYDYGFSKKGVIVRCRCASPKCRGTINQT